MYTSCPMAWEILSEGIRMVGIPEVSYRKPQYFMHETGGVVFEHWHKKPRHAHRSRTLRRPARLVIGGTMDE